MFRSIFDYFIVPIIAFFFQCQLTIFVKENYVSKVVKSEPMISFLYIFGLVIVPLFTIMFLIGQINKLKHSIKIDYILIPIVSTVIADIIYHVNLYQSGLFSSKVYRDLFSQSFIFYIVCQVWLMTLIMLLADFFVNLLKQKAK